MEEINYSKNEMRERTETLMYKAEEDRRTM